MRLSTDRPPARANATIYRSLTAPLIAAAGVIGFAMYAGSGFLTESAATTLAGWFVVFAAASSFAAGAIAGRRSLLLATLIGLTSGTTVGFLLQRLGDVRAIAGDGGAPLGGVLIVATCVTAALTSFASSLLGGALRRRFARR